MKNNEGHERWKNRSLLLLTLRIRSQGNKGETIFRRKNQRKTSGNHERTKQLKNTEKWEGNSVN
jgi:hypothetical protein